MPVDSRNRHGRSAIWERGPLKAAIRDARRALGARLREERDRIGLTQEEAAERIGIHPKHLQRIEIGGVNVTLATLVAVAEGYGIPLPTLFTVATTAVEPPTVVASGSSERR